MVKVLYPINPKCSLSLVLHKSNLGRQTWTSIRYQLPYLSSCRFVEASKAQNSPQRFPSTMAAGHERTILQTLGIALHGLLTSALSFLYLFEHPQLVGFEAHFIPTPLNPSSAICQEGLSKLLEDPRYLGRPTRHLTSQHIVPTNGLAKKKKPCSAIHHIVQSTCNVGRCEKQQGIRADRCWLSDLLVVIFITSLDDFGSASEVPDQPGHHIGCV